MCERGYGIIKVTLTHENRTMKLLAVVRGCCEEEMKRGGRERDMKGVSKEMNGVRVEKRGRSVGDTGDL